MARSNVDTNRIVVTAIDPAGLDVLDVGCGPGTALRIAAGLQPPPARLIGIDRSVEMTRTANQRLKRTARRHPVRIVTAPVEHLPFGDATADLAWAINTVKHWAAVHAGLAEIFRVLRPGGHLLIAERYGPPAHQHRPRGSDGAAIERLTAVARTNGWTHLKTSIHTTNNDRFALITLAKRNPVASGRGPVRVAGNPRAPG
jgi:ubiquinone/menaquinone biosynthesis C-methylase UbiE